MSDELDDIRKLAGLDHFIQGGKNVDWSKWTGSNLSITGNEKGKIQREKNIKPGTEQWFKLWFSRPDLTKENPVGDEPLKTVNQKAEDDKEDDDTDQALKDMVASISNFWKK